LSWAACSRELTVIAGLALAALLASAAHAADRSPAVKAEFRRANPCPSTGRTTGACPGWQVDHATALICGGKDEVSNLHWLSVTEHKAKTRVEVKLCRSHERASGRAHNPPVRQ